MLEIKNLSFSYDKHGKLFNNLDLGLQKGNIYGLLGKNGAGKTSLLKIMCGLLYAQEGAVKNGNFDVANRQPQLLSDIYMIPEEFYLPDFKIDTYVDNFSKFYKKFDHKLFNDLIAEFEIDRNKKLNNLSYGQKKKFIIAFAISSMCSIILMDEPTNGLDIPSKSKFRKAIASAINDERIFLISTHQVRDLENLIDPVLIIENGKIIFNHNINNISNKLSFIKTENENQISENILYSEPIFGGQYLVTERNSQEESPIDFEILFNAVLSDKNQITNFLKN
ncbi:MAG: ABC transporter ATP-binding protein [Bacteroidetes bacterium]|jgi:ABC-2 type transport system ATP-binding protein|nr:ABC transporter ATP-binding protein [Bacteroidota bacterium]MBT6687375.1 ABC transporter ATP-binding protein [Bacteroidota bacterium]MBT7143926.1 ABC transporter ATP-binding protein [Bacteroidota bacterium]MBT7492430.1 ABC transporter ATP-binding protein [Bacteroidota bacterium]